MTTNISSIEEFDIARKLQFPHTLKSDTVSQKVGIAYYVLSKNINDLLLITPSGFSSAFIFAGISDKHIDHIAKNASDEYKKGIMNLLSNQFEIKEIFEIAKAMDEDLGENITQNQDRVKNVIQYIKDNRIAFEF